MIADAGVVTQKDSVRGMQYYYKATYNSSFQKSNTKRKIQCNTFILAWRAQLHSNNLCCSSTSTFCTSEWYMTNEMLGNEVTDKQTAEQILCIP